MITSGRAGPAVRMRELGRSDRIRPFLDVAWRINAGSPNWVPPLRAPLRALLDRDRHPFHEHADVAYFLAEREGVAVGRIAAVVNHRHNDFHGERTGFFGFFECEEDPATAAELLAAAAAWVGERGMERIRGPASFSTNEECGLLVEGYDDPPAVMMPYNPPYYRSLMEGAGLEPVRDLLAYRLRGEAPPGRLVRGGERIARRVGARVRPLDMKRFDAEVATVRDIYNSAWSRNWGFVPMTEAELAQMARELRPVIEPRLCLFVEVEDRPVGFSLALPDLNQAIKPLDGRLLPFGFLRFLWYRRRIDRARILTLGLRPEYRRHGLGAVLYLRTWLEGSRLGYHKGEASWILEDNLEMRQALEKMGADPYKRYRVYEREVAAVR